MKGNVTENEKIERRTNQMALLGVKLIPLGMLPFY
jgi:hypothetical protein